MPNRESPPPLISAIMIFLDAAPYIAEAIDSVLGQTYQQWELLLIDDGSTDGSSDIARGYAERFPDRIRYFTHEGFANRGMSASRNLGIRHARGGYLAFLDADDVWLPEKMERQLPLLEARPDVAMVYSPTIYWHSWTGVPEDQDKDHMPPLDVAADTVYAPGTLSLALYPIGIGTAPCICSLLVRTDAVRSVGGFEESFRGFYEDQAFLSKMYLRHSIFVSRECWDRYRWHPASCSALVRTDGGYDNYRQTFLRWFKEYLDMQPDDHDGVRRALDASLGDPAAPADGSPGYKTLRLLRVAEGNLARLIFPADQPEVTHIDISHCESPAEYDIQLSQPRLPLRAGVRYSLGFLARADAPRSVGVGVALGQAPWTNLGFYDRVDLGPEWQPFERQFTAAENADNARVHFDAGASSVSMSVSCVALRSLEDGSLVRPGPGPGGARKATPTPEPEVEPGKVQFGSFRRVTPISQDFGFERGLPIDRHYVEQFLASRGDDVRGHVLEVGERTYTKRYGGDKVAKSDVLHVVEGDPEATIIADLTSAEHIPSDSFDCVILTQTLQLIYDVDAAIATIHRILKPGGVLLATFPGISQTYDNEWGGNWCWSFTRISATRLFGDAFGEPQVTIETFGNVLASMSFLHGLAVEELSPAELAYHEPGYDVTIAVRARKAGGPPDRPRKAAVRESRGTAPGAPAAKAAVLMYHRVATLARDPWWLAVTPSRFAEQMQALASIAEPMSIDGCLSSVADGPRARPAVAVTFDDGYADNLHHALPVLSRFDVPATFFVTSGYVGGTREFWWDALDALLLAPHDLPEELTIDSGGTRRQWHLGRLTHYSADDAACHALWRAPDHPPTIRHEIFVALWAVLQVMPAAEQSVLLSRLRDWAGVSEAPRDTHRPLTTDELRTLAADPRATIGAHSVSHPILNDFPTERQREEIEGSRIALEALLERRVEHFAYPYGAYSSDTVAVARAAGLRTSCTTREARLERSPDRFEIPRFEVKDWSGEEFGERLRLWLQ